MAGRDLQWELFFAVVDGEPAKVSELLEAGAEVDEETVTEALTRCDRRVLGLLFERGASLERPDSRMRTRLHGEARLEQAALLLEMGAAVNASDDQGWTPLHGAAAYGDTALAELLLRAGGRADARTANNRTPADFARFNGHDDLAAALDTAATGHA